MAELWKKWLMKLRSYYRKIQFNFYPFWNIVLMILSIIVTILIAYINYTKKVTALAKGMRLLFATK